MESERISLSAAAGGDGVGGCCSHYSWYSLQHLKWLPNQPQLPLILLLLLTLFDFQVKLVNSEQQSVVVATTATTTSELNLEHQALFQVPVKHLCQVIPNSINLLNLADNQIAQLEDDQFKCVSSSLRILILTGNQIEKISSDAFKGLNLLQVLRLDHNQLTSVPSAGLSELYALRHLNLAYNRIEALEFGAFKRLNGFSSLISLDLKGNPLSRIASGSLTHLTRLQTLSLSGIRGGGGGRDGEFYPLEGLSELRFLHLDRMKLNSVPENLCSFSRKLSSLVLKSNQLKRIPQFTNCNSLLLLDLSYNQISGSLESANLSSTPELLDLYLGHNKLQLIHENAFTSLRQLQVLELNDNLLAHIHPLAFLPLRASIKHLDLARNEELIEVPGTGLEQLISFRAVGNEKLRHLPQLTSARALVLTHAYHCCEYTPMTAEESDLPAMGGKSLLSRLLELLSSSVSSSKSSDEIKRDFNEIQTNTNQLTEQLLWPQLSQSGNNNNVRPSINPASWLNTSLAAAASRQQHQQLSSDRVQATPHTSIRCSPAPGPFQPCRALFDNWWLRVGICCVFIFAFTGNLLVIIVLGSARRSNASSALTSIMWPAGHSKRHIDVPRFLVLNLAIADLMMALYLGILAAVDLGTLGEFRLFAIDWQRSKACKLAGFLAVLSSELSVFILAIITLERNYAITNAVHLNRRLSLQKAALIVLFGYTLALAMAIIPLNGRVSDYGKYAICLPLEMDSDSLGSQLYAASLITINTLSFILLLGCYLRMYCAIRGSQAWNANDLRIARRMSILVLTDFLCWVPIIGVALGSLTGYQPVGPLGLKLIIIFVLPLNSVANPFLYAITTKKFKRDLDTLTRQLAALTTLGECGASKSNGVRDPNQIIYTNYRRHQCKTANGQPPTDFHHHHHQVPMIQRVKSGRATPAATAATAAAVAPTCSCRQSNANNIAIRSQAFHTPKRPKIVLESAPGEYHHRRTNRGTRPLSPSSSALTLEPLMTNSKGAGQTNITQQTSSCQAVPKFVRLSDLSHQLTAPTVAVRSKSACSSSVQKLENHQETSNSYETVSISGGALNWRLVYGPVAKAWSSVQISFSSSAQASQLNLGTTSRIINNQHQQASKQQRQTSNNSAYFTPSTCQDQLQNTQQIATHTNSPHNNLSKDETDISSTTDHNPFTLASPSTHQRRINRKFNERRMSRSLDVVTQQQLMPPVSGSSTELSMSQTELNQDDDQRVLLDRIKKISGSSKAQLPSRQLVNKKRARCQRCRSWSPALLSKLEGCIYQIKSKFPGLTTGNHRAANPVSTQNEDTFSGSSSDESGNLSDISYTEHEDQTNKLEVHDDDDDENNLDGTSQSDDKFNEDVPIPDWNYRKNQQRNSSHRVKKPCERKLPRQYSSTNSDTLSTRTAGTMLTNMSVSSDSSTSIPQLR